MKRRECVTFSGEDLVSILVILERIGIRVSKDVRMHMDSLTFSRESDGEVRCSYAMQHDFHSQELQVWERHFIGSALKEAALREGAPVCEGGREIDSYVRLSTALSLIGER